eukprot:TRINITY_DN13039_c0_g1_i1.p1 TRINITY_DN13039_c0_g1~~TRINITY_DN13039_c0_g1_i1.p1  ORF type:complete len:124 (+),score=12.38 TRINITY_DN13039_c0_g1_i1:125-496(+)
MNVARVSAHARLYRKLRKFGVDEKFLKDAAALADGPAVMTAGFQAIRRLSAARVSVGDCVLCTSSITYQRFKQQVLDETVASLQAGEQPLETSSPTPTTPWSPACSGGGTTLPLSPSMKELSS